MAPSFLSMNGNKRSITLDLRRPEAIEIVKRLVVGADVVWENFRGGVMDRLGLGYEALSAINPRAHLLRRLRASAAPGPSETTAAFDGKLQAMSGIMSITGEPRTVARRARGSPSATPSAASPRPLAVASALYQRTHTGRGQLVDVAMLDAALAFIAGPVSEYTVAGIEAAPDRQRVGEPEAHGEPLPGGRRLHRAVPSSPRSSSSSLMQALGRPDALADPRFKDWPARTENEPALREIIEAAMATDDPRTWETRLTAADVPCGSIWKVHEIVRHPQLEHRDVLQTIDTRYGPMELVGAGFRLEHGSPSLDREPPTLGEHTDEILKEAGYSAEEIERLHREAIV